MSNSKLKLSIAYLYPRSMNIYGDRGNVLCLTKRCEWRGIDVKVDEIEVGEGFKPSKYDLVFAGGGQDRHQLRIADDLQSKKKTIHEAVEQGTVFLLVCGSYQMFGHYFKTAEGTELPGISVLDVYTVASNQRKIGNVVVNVEGEQPFVLLPENIHTLVGFENHSGNTYFQNNQLSITNDQWKTITVPLATVLKGFGNNGEDKTEGARFKNCFGTYLHGSLLPKNPHFADYLIQLALEKRYKEAIKLDPLDDNLEFQAHQFILDHRR